VGRSHPWYLTFAARPEARLRLYCLPCAGGGPSMYRAWAREFPSWMELRAVRLPGRQGRHREQPFTDADQAVRGLLDGLADELTGRFAFFGHSMGALLAYRMTRELSQAGAVMPRLLAVASWPPRGAPAAAMPDPEDTDAGFREASRLLGGVPDEIFNDPAVMRLTLPLLRADFRLCRSYAYQPRAPLDLPLAAFGGCDDQVVPPGLLETWQQETTDYRGLHLYPGDHFFLHQHVPELVRVIADAAGGRNGPRR
jgi:medium-chain acyl-[acyl-carrier-protein] hydrolase